MTSASFPPFPCTPPYHAPRTLHPAPCTPPSGQNPWSDIGCRETLALAGRYFARALSDSNDLEAREAMHWAATLAGTALNNAGTAPGLTLTPTPGPDPDPDP